MAMPMHGGHHIAKPVSGAREPVHRVPVNEETKKNGNHYIWLEISHIKSIFAPEVKDTKGIVCM